MPQKVRESGSLHMGISLSSTFPSPSPSPFTFHPFTFHPFTFTLSLFTLSPSLIFSSLVFLHHHLRDVPLIPAIQFNFNNIIFSPPSKWIHPPCTYFIIINIII